MNFLMKKIMFKKKNKKNKKLRKFRLSSSNIITQNHLVNVVEEEAKKKRLQSNAFLPDELIAEIISVLSIKTILQLKCVSKSWNILISDPTFAEKHLSKSSQNQRLILTPRIPASHYLMNTVVSFPVRRLLQNQSTTVSGDNYNHARPHTVDVVGTYKGLLCLLFGTCPKYWFRLWNPAIRTISKELGTLSGVFQFSFGCDISTGTYKAVAYRVEKDEDNEGTWRSRVKIFSFSDNCWRDIESFPLVPINRSNKRVHLSGTVNWLALSNYHYSFYRYKDITSVQQFVIVSLDLSTETYTQFLPPSGFDQVPRIEPTLVVLLDCLCFSHDFKRTEFVIWQMKEFGVQESWTQLFRIEYSNLQINPFPLVNIEENIADMELLEDIYDWKYPLLPLHLSQNGDTLILANYKDNLAIIYNTSDKSVKTIRVENQLCWFSTMNYVESLVSPPWKSSNKFFKQSDSEMAMIVGDIERSLEEDQLTELP